MDTVGTLEKFHEEGSAQIHPVILSGGAGTRLWPLSRASYPKQLLKLSSQRTMLQDTVARGLIDVGFAAPLLVCNEDHRFLVDDQLQQIGIKPQAILLEPKARNTGPAIAAAALWLLARDPDALMLVQPSDHVIASPADFHRGVMRGLAAAQEGRLVTFGIKPGRPDTGYGYIQSGEALSDGVFGVDRFVEKPDRETAQRFLDSGAFFWNSGIFLLSARAYLGELSRINPAMLDACERAVRDGQEDLAFFRLSAEPFGEAPSLSIDHAVMEHTSRAAVVPVDMAWSDVGSWPALRDIAKADGDGNVLQGDVLAERMTNSYVRSEGRLVAAVGLDNVVVVATDDAVLVADANSAAEVSGIVSQAARPEQERIAAARHLPSAVGPLPVGRRRRPLPGQAHHREAGRQAQPAEALPSRRALGRRARHGDGPARRGAHARARERVRLHPDRHRAPAGEPRQAAAPAHRGPIGAVSRRGRHRARVRQLRPRLSGIFDVLEAPDWSHRSRHGRDYLMKARLPIAPMSGRG